MDSLNFAEEFQVGYWEWNGGPNSSVTNPSLKSLLGYSPTDFPDNAEAWKKLIPEHDLEMVNIRLNDHIASKGEVPFSCDVRVRHKQGHVLDIYLVGRVTAWTDEGGPLAMMGSHTDITLLKQEKKELLDIKRLLDRTSEKAMVGGWEIDLETRKVSWTEETCNIFEVPAHFQPRQGSSSQFFKKGPDREALLEAFKIAVTTGEPYDLELKVVTAKGNEIWTRTIGQPEFENGKCIRIYGIFQNITGRKQYEDQLKQQQAQLITAKEAAEEATLAKSRFLSVMSHEIRTPMNAVIGFTNLLLQNPREDQQEYLNILKFSGENLMVLINDILDLNKIDAGKIVFEEVEFNIKNLLINIHASMRQQAIEKHLFLEINLDPDVPDHVKGDPVRIGQVVTNLLNNAIKFTAAGKVSLIAKLVKKENGKAQLHIAVTDTGIGIPKDKQEYIFEIFSQASAETTRKYGGTGLGLAITKRLLELMGSCIRLDSELDKGSAFSFDLTLQLAETGEKVAQPARVQLSRGPVTDARILVVEDNPINVLLVKRFLKQWQMDCDVAENGKIAVEMVQEYSYGLVLMDIQMPEMDGYEATEQIRSLPGEEFKNLPIIALTASAVSNLEDKVYTSGMNDFVSKPFAPAELLQKIEAHLNPLWSVCPVHGTRVLTIAG